MKKKQFNLLRNRYYKRKKKRHFQGNKNSVYYSIGTRCTWKEKLPTMNNPNYILLYGIAPNINDLSVEVFKQEYFKKPIELYASREYVNQLREKRQSRADKNTEEIALNRNCLGVIIKRCKIPETSEIADVVQKAYDNQLIKSHVDEIKFISQYCRKTEISAYTFPPKYAEVDSGLSTMRIVKPKAYIIVNPNIIVDVAIGVDSIDEMVKGYANQNKSELIEKHNTYETTRTRTASEAKQAIMEKGLFKGFKK